MAVSVCTLLRMVHFFPVQCILKVLSPFFHFPLNVLAASRCFWRVILSQVRHKQLLALSFDCHLFQLRLGSAFALVTEVWLPNHKNVRFESFQRLRCVKDCAVAMDQQTDCNYRACFLFNTSKRSLSSG